MSANNRRIRRVIVDILWAYGPMTKEELADRLQDMKSIRQVPSPNSLSALLSKNGQVVSVGKEKVESLLGAKSKHTVFSIDEELIKCKEDILYTRPQNAMTPKELKSAMKCEECGRRRIMLDEASVCLHCQRGRTKHF